MDLADAERWFSAERIAPYVAACAGDRRRALALYGWNADVGAAFWRTLGHIEILVRNAMHAQLTRWSSASYGDPCWYLMARDLFSARANAAVAQARFPGQEPQGHRDESRFATRTA